MNSRSAFLQALRLPPDLTDETCTRSVSELILLAVKEQSHPVSIKELREAVSQYGCADYLEPLDVLPMLLPCPDDNAMDLIRMCAVNSSPKEVMIVVQEAIERVQTRLDAEEDESENESEFSLLSLLHIFRLIKERLAISGSRLRKRSALELCSPVLRDVTSLVNSVSSLSTKEEGRALIIQVSRLVKSLSVWASTVADTTGQQEIKNLLRELLDSTVVSCATSIQASLAARAAQSCFPRLFMKSSVNKAWQDGAGAMLEVQHALEGLETSPQAIYGKASSFSDIIYLAHWTPPVTLCSAASHLHHLLINALQMNMAIDESLFLLLRFLTHEDASISPEATMSLCTVLTAVASTHLDPTIRQLNLRLLSLTLFRLPPPSRLEVLLKLSTDQEFPQIRGPAVGLLKEAVLEALALPPEHSYRNPFASPELLRIFGKVLFRPNPPQFFSENKTKEELEQSLELLRISDCLSFYYVLLQRDRENKTGVREKDNIKSVQSSLLRPLQQFLADQSAKEEQPLMVVLSLQVGLERIDGALKSLDLEGSTV